MTLLHVLSLLKVEALKQSKQTEKAQMFLQNLLAKVPEDLTVLTFAYNYAMEEDRLSDVSFTNSRRAINGLGLFRAYDYL